MSHIKIESLSTFHLELSEKDGNFFGFFFEVFCIYIFVLSSYKCFEIINKCDQEKIYFFSLSPLTGVYDAKNNYFTSVSWYPELFWHSEGIITSQIIEQGFWEHSQNLHTNGDIVGRNYSDSFQLEEYYNWKLPLEV